MFAEASQSSEEDQPGAQAAADAKNEDLPERRDFVAAARRKTPRLLRLEQRFAKRHCKEPQKPRIEARCQKIASRALRDYPAEPALFSLADSRLSRIKTEVDQRMSSVPQEERDKSVADLGEKAERAQQDYEASQRAAAAHRAIADEKMAAAVAVAGDNGSESVLGPAVTAEATARNSESERDRALKTAQDARVVHGAVAAQAAVDEAETAATTAEKSPSPENAADAAAKLDAAEVANAKAKKDDEPSSSPQASDSEEGDDSNEGQKSESEKELDRLKAGKLIRWGITAGIGPSFHQPLAYHRHAPSLPGAGALAYVMFHPAYWRDKPETNVYCSNRWSGAESEAAASRAADDIATERATLIVDRILAQEKAGALTNGSANQLACAGKDCINGDEVVTLSQTANGTGEDSKAARTALIALVQRSTLGWRSGISVPCTPHMFGLWLGYPLKFTTTVPYQDGTMGATQVRRARLEATPIVAFGLGFSPNAYVSILGGISVSKANLPPGTDNDDEAVVSFVLGVGGNLDILTLLSKAGS